MCYLNATDGDRRYKSQWFIKKLLEEDLEKDPNDTRSIYYLARTNSGINKHTAAYYYYDLLAKRSKWDEEVYHGLTMKAIEAKFIDTISWKDRQTLFIDAINYKPISMDAMHSLAQDHFDSGRFHLAYLFIHRAVHLTPPAGLITVENVLLRPTQYLYDYEGYRLMVFAAREIGEWDECVKAFLHVLKVQPADEIVKGRVTLCEDKLREQGKPVPTQETVGGGGEGGCGWRWWCSDDGECAWRSAASGGAYCREGGVPRRAMSDAGLASHQTERAGWRSDDACERCWWWWWLVG